MRRARHPRWILSLLLFVGCSPDLSQVRDAAAVSSGDMAQVALPSNCTGMNPPSNSYVECAGAFSAGQAQSLCPFGYSLATIWLPELQAACLDPNLTFNRAFFAANVPRYGDRNDPGNLASCQPMVASGYLPGFMGCGYNYQATFPAPTCGGWPRGIPCYWGLGTFGCSSADLNDALNTNPKSGVICSRF